jgi:sec-independent protein translocase protein TatB
MFGLGFWEIAIILAVALIVLGPSKLPELARGLGKGLREFRKATEDFKSTIEDEVYRPEPPKPPPPAQIARDEPIAPASTALPPPLAMPSEPPAATEPPAPAKPEDPERGPA